MMVSGGGLLRLASASAVELRLGSLVVDQAAGGCVDVGGSRITVSAGGITQAALVADLAAGLGSGAWDGTTGITSSVAAAAVAAGTPRSVGWLDQGGGAFTIAFAAAGDTNLDGVLDILDAADVLAGSRYDTGGAAAWNQGDFNYDGIVDVLDVADFTGTALFDAGGYLLAAAGIAAVPEPAACVPAALGVAAIAISRGPFRRTVRPRPPGDRSRSRRPTF
jgi:hypothetical protein